MRYTTGIIGGGFFPTLWGRSHESIEFVSPYSQQRIQVARMLLDGAPVYSILRHGRAHEHGSAVDYLGNVWALKELGCNLAVSVGLCGALTAEYRIGDIVLYDDIIDFRRGSASFFTPEQAVHISVAPMIDPGLSQQLRAFAADESVRIGGTMVVAEGPRYATVAEGRMYRLLGGHLICQTAAPECFLVKECGLQWLGVTLVTDTDNCNPAEFVSTELIFERMKRYETRFAVCIERLVASLRLVDGSSNSGRHRGAVPVNVLSHGLEGVAMPLSTAEQRG